MNGADLHFADVVMAHETGFHLIGSLIRKSNGNYVFRIYNARIEQILDFSNETACLTGSSTSIAINWRFRCDCRPLFVVKAVFHDFLRAETTGLVPVEEASHSTNSASS